MSRPLIITDCDEVLLHMVVPFRDWVDEVHDIHFDLSVPGFVDGMRHKACGTQVEHGRVWDLLRTFFLTEMHRQRPIDGVLTTLAGLSEIADIVVLTNIGEEAHLNRINQLKAIGITHEVYWNLGGKGPRVRKLIDERRPSAVLFVDDLAEHHLSVAEHAPEAWRLHMVGEPLIAGIIAAAPDAHKRIDTWPDAESWIRERLAEGRADGQGAASWKDAGRA